MKLKILLVSILIAVRAVAADASSTDQQTRNLLIQKFERVLLSLAPQDPSYTAVTLRLADLLSERARFDAMTELQTGCIECVAGVKDRQKALRLYEIALEKTPAEGQGKIIFQIGHLNELIGQTQKAELTYLDIIKRNQSPATVAEARAALGEMYFKQRRFAQAREQFELARKGELGQRGLAAYRIAWCYYNEGKIKEGSQELYNILSTPKLLTRNADASVISIDRQFQEEVSRDYATFISRLSPQLEDAKQLYSLSPESTRLANVEFLATELERVGVKDKAISVWQFVQDLQTQPRNRLEGHVRLAALYQDVGQMPQAIAEFEKGLALYPQVQCDQSCIEIKNRLRKFVVDWNRSSKKQPTSELLTAYENYLAVFSDDAEMIYWAAQIAKDLKSYEKAMTLYQTFVSRSAGKDTENALLSQIEAAESSGDVGLQILAYDRYLQYSTKGEKKVEVQYQKAHLLYKQEKYAESAEALRAVALLQTTQAESVRIQAADLSLDALAILKDDARIESWATEYAARFPQKRSEFWSVSRKSLLNQSVNLAATQPDVAWMALARASIADADDSDKIIYYKNKIILAEKLGKYSDGRNAVDSLLKIPTLKQEDQEFALAKKAWFAELALDFSTAFTANQKMKLAELQNDQRLLRLAMFAELAGQPADSYYAQYLNTTKDREKARLVAARLVKESRTPEREFAKFEKTLKEDPVLYTSLALDIYVKTADKKLLKRIVSDKGLVTTPAGKELLRESLLKEMAPLSADLAKQSIGTKTQAEIARGIKKRVGSIDKFEAVAARAVESGDWIAQVMSLTLLEREITRFYNEIIALPLPQGLTPEEEGQYLQLLSQQASPYQIKAQDIQTKLKEFWSGLDKVLADYRGLAGLSTRDIRGFTTEQLASLAAAAPETEKIKITTAINETTAPGAAALPTVAEVERARKVVRENPMNRDGLIKLSVLEKQMGRQTMASYLEARAQKLEEKSQ